jgi:hypothetical protein
MGRLTALTIRRWLQRPRARLTAVGCVLALAGVVAVHHSPTPGQGMDMPGMGMIVCLGVIGTAVAVGVICAVRRRIRYLALVSRLPAGVPPAAVPPPAARAGPPLFLRLARLRR